MLDSKIESARKKMTNFKDSWNYIKDIVDGKGEIPKGTETLLRVYKRILEDSSDHILVYGEKSSIIYDFPVDIVRNKIVEESKIGRIGSYNISLDDENNLMRYDGKTAFSVPIKTFGHNTLQRFRENIEGIIDTENKTEVAFCKSNSIVKELDAYFYKILKNEVSYNDLLRKEDIVIIVPTNAS